MKQQNVVKKTYNPGCFGPGSLRYISYGEACAGSGEWTGDGDRLSVIQLCLAGALFGESGKGKGGTPGFDHGSGITGCCHAAGV